MDRRRITGKLLKAAAWAAGIIVSLMVLLQFVLSPAVLTPVLDRFAAYWLDADLSFSRVGVNVFRSFPNITLDIDGCTVRYDAERFSRFTRCTDSSDISLAGSYIGLFRPGEETDTLDLTGKYDTLAVMSSLSATVNPFALVYKQLRVKQISVKDLRGYAHRFDALNANWNIVRSPDTTDVKESRRDDSTSFTMPVPVIGRITLDGRPTVVFTDRESETALLVSLKSLDLKGNRSSGKSLIQSFRLKVDSVLVANRHVSDTSLIELSRLRLRSARESGFDGSLKLTVGASDAVHGRIFLPADISFKVDVPEVAPLRFDILDFEGDVCGIPLFLKGSAALPKDSLVLDASVDIREGRLGEALHTYGPLFSDIFNHIGTDALLNVHGDVSGSYVYASGRLPDLDISVSIPETGVTWDGENLAALSLECSGSDRDAGRLNLSLDGFRLTSDGGTDIRVEGEVRDVLGKDPLVSVKASAGADLSWWSSRIGSDTTFTFSGTVSAAVNGALRFSQMNLTHFSRADISASATLRNVDFLIPSDSVSVFADSLSLGIEAGENREFDDIPRGARVMLSSISLDTASIRLGDRMNLTARTLICRGHCDGTVLSDASSDSISLHPYFLEVSAGKLALTDSDSTRISLRNTENTLKFAYQDGNDTISTVNLTSATSRIGMRTKDMLAGVRNLKLDFKAVKGNGTSAHGKKRTGSAGAVRDTLVSGTEDDLHFSMGETFGRLYRDWSARGSLSFLRCSVRSPGFPLRTSASDLNMRFTSNMLSLNSLSLKAGDSDLSLNGKVSGIRRTLTGNGVIKAELNLDSEKMDLNELLAAIAVGSRDTAQTILCSDEDMTETLNSSYDRDLMAGADTLSSPLIMLPGNLNAVCRFTGRSISVSDMVVDSLTTVLEMKDRCFRVSEILATTNMGDLSFEGFYATRSKDDISVGMDLSLTGVTAGEVLDMIPSIDTIMPLLSSFNGKLKCQIAGTSRLDTNMNIILPSAVGVVRIGGDSLHLDQTPSVRKITRLLLFKDKHAFNVKTMSVDAQLHDSQLEVFPFVLDIDRYKLALSGKHSFDGPCRYHLSVLKSPLPFKLGLDMYGDSYDKLKFRLVKPKFRSEEKIPAFSATVEQTREMLSKMISDIFSLGVERVMSDEGVQNAVLQKKRSISYQAAEDSNSEAISQQELDDMKRQSGESGDAGDAGDQH